MLNAIQIATGIARLFSRAAASRRIHAAAMAVVLGFGLAACGGGGSSRSAGVTVPDALIPSEGTGTVDTSYMGVSGTAVKQSAVRTHSAGIVVAARRIQGADGNQTLRVLNPPQDVRDAWRAGWTGQGANILIIDEFDGNAAHGYEATMLAREIAPNARYSELQAGAAADGNTIDNRVGRVDVINHFIRSDVTRALPNPATDEQVAMYWRVRSDLRSDLTGAGTAGARLTGTGDAVIVNFAGNQRTDASHIHDNAALVRDAHIGPRTLIVGGLDNYARPTMNPVSAGGTFTENANVSTRASIESYSNVAGARADMQSRFLVEYGETPFTLGAVLCDSGTTATCANRQSLNASGGGTSFAAPRVAGYAALVRDKFPGLSGAQTAKVLLDTATTAGLACHTGEARKSPNCPRNIYGQGRVNITDALSPIGKLE